MSFLHFQSKESLSRRKFIFFGTLAPATLHVSAKEQRAQPHAHPAPPPAKPRGTTPHASRPIFDAHLHCPDDAGNVWQWHPVTRTFEEFDAYLVKTGVQRGIINSVRSQLAKTPQEFIAGNREVARRVEKSKGRSLGACVVNPLFIEEALREMEDCRKQLGMLWVGELCNYTVPYEYTIRQFEQLVDQAVKLKMVLDVHTELDESYIPVVARPIRDKRVLDATDRAYLEKYHTPGAIKYARDLGSPQSRAATLELSPSDSVRKS